MIQTREEAREKCSEYGIPEHMWEAVERWVIDHQACGSFFTLLVSNDLFGAFMTADDFNLFVMQAWVKLMYNEFPSEAWGSPEKVQAWINAGEVQADG